MAGVLFPEIIKEHFRALLQDKIKAKPVTIVLKGFTAYELSVLKQASEEYGCEDRIPVVTPLDIVGIKNEAREFLSRLMITDEKPLVCIYEQYSSVSGALDSGVNLTDRTTVIVENNMFLSSSPALISDEVAGKLMDYFESDNQKIPEELEIYTHFYSDVNNLGQTYFGVKHINKHTDEKITVIPFFESCSLGNFPETHVGIEIESLSDEMWQYIIDLQSTGNAKPVTFIRNEMTNDNGIISVLANVLSSMNISFGVKKYNAFEEISASSRSFLSLLKRQHGENAKFRMLHFYKSPDFSNELVEISQEAVISDIVTQSEKALNKSKDFKNYFITAPTGAGKSLLFQLPAIYLAEQHNAVTIVVSPLIALMKDQVEGLEERGISCATYLNSTISYEEREKRSAQIKNGEKSIVYLAPELLLSCPLNTLLGERMLGLFVVDEAHTVTSWGKDFRVDYWFLGDYLRNARRNGFVFPVLCLTATAVYGGIEDVVNETVATLGLKNARILLGNVKRDNISFDVRTFEKGSSPGSYEQVKLEHTAKVIGEYVNTGEKTLVYCPYITQVAEILRQIDPLYKERVGMYHGQLNNMQKNMYQDHFRSGKISAMVCTKAYGMGIDVNDITHCYHFAPTGNLSDYVQEIGRIARDPNSLGVARIDFSLSDMKYARTLHGISGLKQYQLKEMLRKLYDIYLVKNHRNLLIAPDVFGYMFDSAELENKVKNGLLLLSKDLEEKYGFPVINVRPKTMFTKNFVCVSQDIEQRFVRRYHDLIRRLNDGSTRIVSSRNSSSSDTIIRNSGNIYEVNMSEIWEREFSELTFADFKRRFFEGSLFSEKGENKFWPRVRLTIKYKRPFEEIYDIMSCVLKKFTEVFTDLKDNCGFFEFEDFKARADDVLESLGIDISSEFLRLILEMFVVEVSSNNFSRKSSDKLTFLQKRNGKGSADTTYRVIGNNHLYLKNNLTQLLSQNKPNLDDRQYISYIPVQNNEQKSIVMRLLSLLEILDLSTYEIKGGANVEIFVRINDPMKLRYLSQGRYSNHILRDIERKHKSAMQTMCKFFQCELSTEQRWDVIENYFLGNELYVRELLGITEDDQNQLSQTSNS